MNKRQITNPTIEHIVVISDKSFEHVITGLEERLGVAAGMDNILLKLKSEKASWEQTTKTIEKFIGKSGLAIFSKIEHGTLLSLKGKPSKCIQYTIGNPLFAIQMTEHILAAALYAPFHLAVYEGDNAKTFLSYDRFSSLLLQFHNEEVFRVAQLVDKSLDELLAAVI